LARGKEIKEKDENKNFLPLSSGILLTDNNTTLNLIWNFK
jgi:hypothetical protein